MCPPPHIRPHPALPFTPSSGSQSRRCWPRTTGPVPPRSGDRTPEHLGVTGLCPCGQWGEGVLCPPLRPGTESLPCLPGSSHGPSASSARARRSLYLGCQGGRPHPNWVTSAKSHFRMKSGPLALGGQGCSLLVGGTASNPQHPSPFCEMFRPSRLACGILVAKPCCCIERAES